MGKTAEMYRVDIGFSRHASLGIFEFEGANKRSRPHLDNGQLVYCLVKQAHRNNMIEPDLTCIHPATMKSDGFGLLEGGYVVRVPVSYCRRLLASGGAGSDKLQELAKQIRFEVAIGINGMIWVKSDSVSNTIQTVNVIRQDSAILQSK